MMVGFILLSLNSPFITNHGDACHQSTLHLANLFQEMARVRRSQSTWRWLTVSTKGHDSKTKKGLMLRSVLRCFWYLARTGTQGLITEPSQILTVMNGMPNRTHRIENCDQRCYKRDRCLSHNATEKKISSRALHAGFICFICFFSRIAIGWKIRSESTQITAKGINNGNIHHRQRTDSTSEDKRTELYRHSLAQSPNLGELRRTKGDFRKQGSVFSEAQPSTERQPERDMTLQSLPDVREARQDQQERFYLIDTFWLR